MYLVGILDACMCRTSLCVSWYYWYVRLPELTVFHQSCLCVHVSQFWGAERA